MNGIIAIPSDFNRSTPGLNKNPHNPLHIGHNECNQVSVTLANSIDNTPLDLASNPTPPPTWPRFKFPLRCKGLPDGPKSEKPFSQIDSLTLGSTMQGSTPCDN